MDECFYGEYEQLFVGDGMNLSEGTGLVICIILILVIMAQVSYEVQEEYYETMQFCESHKDIPSEWGDLNCTAWLNNETVTI